LDYFSEKDLGQGEYRLEKLGNDKTRLDAVFRNKWKDGEGPTEEKFYQDTKASWDAYATAL
jgi:hypothetical protein